MSNEVPPFKPDAYDEPMRPEDLHVVPEGPLDKRTHGTQDFCWCEPDIINICQETGRYIWLHRPFH